MSAHGMGRSRSRAFFARSRECRAMYLSAFGFARRHCSCRLRALSIPVLAKGMNMTAAGQQKTRTGVPARTGQAGGTPPPESGGLIKMPPRRTWIWFLALLVANFVLLRVLKPGGGLAGLMGIGQSKARRYDQATDQKVTFDDVAGIDEAEHELVEIVDFLRDPAKYTRLGGAAPKGVLLIGAPGTGKTLLARAVAGEANVPFFSMGASEFVEMIVGVGASRVRDLFKHAREAAPAITFIDELDAIGRARGGMSFGGNDEREQTLNQILT